MLCSTPIVSLSRGLASVKGPLFAAVQSGGHRLAPVRVRKRDGLYTGASILDGRTSADPR